MTDDTAATVAEIQYRLKRLYIIAGVVLVVVTVAAVVFLDAIGHFADVKSLAAIVGPAISGAIILITNYRGGRLNLQTQGQVLHQTNGLLSQHVERAVTKVAASPNFQNVVASKIADNVIDRASLAPLPGGKRKGDPKS